MSDSETLYNTSDEERRDEEYISVGGKVPCIGPIMKYIPANGTVSDEAFEIVFHPSANIMTFAGNHDQS
jgi:hypothetical protein